MEDSALRSASSPKLRHPHTDLPFTSLDRLLTRIRQRKRERSLKTTNLPTKRRGRYDAFLGTASAAVFRSEPEFRTMAPKSRLRVIDPYGLDVCESL